MFSDCDGLFSPGRTESVLIVTVNSVLREMDMTQASLAGISAWRIDGI